PDAEGACRNRKQALVFMRRFAGRAVTLVDVVAAGDKVVVVMRPESGEEVANLATFRDGRVVEIVHYPDPDEALAAAAAASAAPAAKVTAATGVARLRLDTPGRIGSATRRSARASSASLRPRRSLPKASSGRAGSTRSGWPSGSRATSGRSESGHASTRATG